MPSCTHARALLPRRSGLPEAEVTLREVTGEQIGSTVPKEVKTVSVGMFSGLLNTLTLTEKLQLLQDTLADCAEQVWDVGGSSWTFCVPACP